MVAPLTGTTEEGVLDNFIPDPQRDIKLRRLLNESIDGQSTSDTRMSSRSQSMTMSQTNDEAPEFNYTYSQRGTDQPNFDYSYSNEMANPQINQFTGVDFMNQYADMPQPYQRDPGYFPTFPEYMPQRSDPSYGFDNQYQFYENYDSPAQYTMDQMGDYGSYDLGNFLDMGQVPQSQNNFSQAGDFFSKGYAQMEQAAKQETKADKRIRMAGSRGVASDRFK